MKKGLFFGLILLFLFFTFVTGVGTQTVTLVCEDKPDVPSVMGEGSQISATRPGLSIEMLGIVAKHLNIEFKIRRYPWERCLEMLKNGDTAGLFTASYKDDRKVYGEYPMKNGQPDPNRRMFSNTYVFYVLKGTKFPWDGKTLGAVNGNIGAPAGYSIVDDLRKMGATVDESPSTLNDLQKLVAGRLIAVAALEQTGDFYLRKNPDLAAKIEKVNPPIVTKPYYMMFSHQFYAASKDLAEKIWDEIAKVRESAEYLALFDKYLQ